MTETCYFLTNFYRFLPLTEDRLQEVATSLETSALEGGWLGLGILGVEGVNMSIATTSADCLEKAKAVIRGFFGNDILFKDFRSEVRPFRRFVLKVKREIVTTGTMRVLQTMAKNHHLSPKEWDEAINSGDSVMIDTRNWYETQLGKFRGAIVPDIEKFSEFPEYLENQGIERSQKILIYCTGGIRCEKGILELQSRGYENVFQLEGGIFEYLRQRPNKEFEGECFVFDQRVAIQQDLSPSSTYTFCPHCGQPAAEKIVCRSCGATKQVCRSCLAKDASHETCSKDCAYHFRRVFGADIAGRS